MILATVGILSKAATSGGTGFYRSITIDFTKIPNTTQSNFPVLIAGTYSYLATVANGGKAENANGYDIGFYSDSGLTTKLKWETEKYTASTGAVVYWVKIPSLSHTTNTVIYMGYGNTSITTDQSDVANVWDSDYKAIYHMNDNAGNTTITDTKGNSSAVNSVNTSTVSVTGKIGSAINYAATDYAGASYTSALNLPSGVTISAWVNFTEVTNLHTIIGKPYAGSHTNPYWDWFLGSAPSGAGSKYVIRIGSTEILSNSSASTGAWHFVVATANGTDIKQYVNGALDKTTANSALPSNSNSQGVKIAANVGNGEFMTGYLEEIRVSNLARSGDWITAEYNNQNSPSTFYAVGSETSL